MGVCLFKDTMFIREAKEGKRFLPEVFIVQKGTPTNLLPYTPSHFE
jgi:hypothetical protein